MTQEKKVQTAAVMDVTGVERAAQDAVRAVSGMATGIEREGKRAGKGVEAIGDGADAADRKIDAKTKSIADRIRRLTQQSQRELAALAASSDGGAGSASAVEYESALKGADVSKLQPRIAALRQLQSQVDSLSASMRAATAGGEFVSSIEARINALQRQASATKATEADLLALRAAELGVAQQADPLIAKLRATAAAADQAAAASRKAAAGDNFLSGLNAQATAIGKTRADLLELKAAELGVTDKARAMIEAIRAADNKLYGVGQTSKATAAALRGVPAQFTDIVVSLQGGQNPIQVFLQQGGQLKDMFGGIGPAARALGGYIFGLINPFTVAAGVVGLLAAAYISAQNDISKMQRALIESGNQAGVTSSQIRDMAGSIAGLGSGTTGKAIEVLSMLAKTGDVGAAGLQRYAAAAIQMERVGGQAAEKTAEAFNELGRGPTEAAAKLNRQINFLTPSIYNQIKALEDQGRATEAARIAQDAYANALEQRTPEMLASLGLVERGWLKIKEASAGAWDAIKGIGRPDTLSQQIDTLSTELRKLDALSASLGGNTPRIDAKRAALAQELDGLRRVEQGERAAAGAAQLRAQATAAMERIAKGRDERLDNSAKEKRELAKYRVDAKAADIPLNERLRDEAAIREKYRDKSKTGGDRGLARAKLAEELQDIRSAEQERQTIYKQSEAIIEAQRQAGLLSEREYYEAKREFIGLDESSKVSALEAEIAVMQKFKGSATDEARVRKDITAAEQKLSQARSEAAGKGIVLGYQEAEVIDARRRALVELNKAAEVEYTALVRRLKLQTQNAGLSDRRQAEEAELESVAASFTQKQAQIEAEYRNGRLRGQEEQYQKELDLLIREEGRQLKAIEESHARKRQVDNDYRIGYQRALGNVIDSTFETANRTANLTETAFKGLGDALTDVFTKGKADWGSLEQTIVSGINRIIIEQQLIRPIAQYLQGGGSGSSFENFFGNLIGSVIGGSVGGGGAGYPDALPTRGGRAGGGYVQSGGLYEINETGKGAGEVLNVGNRQYLMALQDGYVSPVPQGGAASGGNTMVVNNHFTFSSPASRETQQQLSAAAGQGVQRAMARQT